MSVNFLTPFCKRSERSHQGNQWKEVFPLCRKVSVESPQNIVKMSQHSQKVCLFFFDLFLVHWQMKLNKMTIYLKYTIMLITLCFCHCFCHFCVWTSPGCLKTKKQRHGCKISQRWLVGVHQTVFIQLSSSTRCCIIMSESWKRLSIFLFGWFFSKIIIIKLNLVTGWREAESLL